MAMPGTISFLAPELEKESRVSLALDTSLGIPEKTLLIYYWWKRIKSHRECVPWHWWMQQNWSHDIWLYSWRTREVTLIHTLNCAFLRLYCVSKIALTMQMDSKTTRGKWWPVLSELLVSEDGFMRMIGATWTIPGILCRWLFLKRKIARLWFLPTLAEGPMMIFVCFPYTLGIESRALSMLGKYSH